MPIYAYKCESCGFAKDVLQKLSDAPLTDCPACGASDFKKQLTAAGFQLKGSGWYATDFKGGAAASPGAPANAEAPATAVDSVNTGGSAAAKAEPVTPSASGGCGGACSCH